MEFCPVCLLRKGLAGGTESGESSVSEETVEPATLKEPAPRFEHYGLATQRGCGNIALRRAGHPV